MTIDELVKQIPPGYCWLIKSPTQEFESFFAHIWHRDTTWDNNHTIISGFSAKYFSLTPHFALAQCLGALRDSQRR